MKSRRFSKSTLAAGGVLFFLFFLSPAHPQDRPPYATARHATTSQAAPPDAATTTAMELSADEQALLDAANRERLALHLQPLRWDAILASAARQHAIVMTREHDLSHQYPGEPPLDQRAAEAGARFDAIAENIAVGPNAEEIHDGWMHSPGHRKNILNPGVTAVGIAVVRGRDGLYAVQDFSRLIPDLSVAQQEQKTIALLSSFGLQSIESTSDARKTCAAANGFSGGRPVEIFRYETADLSKLPDEVNKALRAKPFRRAEVGACAASAAAGFVRFRFAVVFY